VIATRLKRLAFRFLRATGLAGWIFRHMSFILPVDRLVETETLIAFFHPQPAYRFHVVIVPKASYPTLEALPPTDTAFLGDLFAATQSLVKRFGLNEGGYRLIVNGGSYQDFPHLHFHLVSDVNGDMQANSA
jgi:histidine triad (HIT) family protein